MPRTIINEDIEFSIFFIEFLIVYIYFDYTIFISNNALQMRIQDT